jgi:predicted DNA-binding transcriptional regulator AlpA
MAVENANPSESDDFLTVPEVSKRYRMHPTSVSGLCRSGEFPGAYRNGKGRGHWRIPEVEIKAYVRRRSQRAALNEVGPELATAQPA